MIIKNSVQHERFLTVRRMILAKHVQFKTLKNQMEPNELTDFIEIERLINDTIIKIDLFKHKYNL